MVLLRMLLLMLTLLPLSSNLQAGLWDTITTIFGGEEMTTPPNIRILLAHDLEGIQLEVKGKYSLYDPYTNSFISTRFAGKSRYIQAVSDGLKWGEAFPGLYQLKIKPEDSDTFSIVDNKAYKGSLFIYDIGGNISVVNQIPVEEFICCHLANYDGLDLHPETWAAIAIVARTNAYFQAVNPKNTYWAVDGQKIGFRGSVKPSNQNILQAINSTRYMIVSRTGVYEGAATPFAAQFGPLTGLGSVRDSEVSKISLEEANQMAKEGEHAAGILARAFPGTSIMLMQYAN